MKKIALLLDIKPGEGRPLALLFLMSFLLGAANNFVQTSAFPLFLSQYSASLLPWTYLLNAVLLPLLTFGYLRAGRRLPFGLLLIGVLALLALVTATFWLGLLFAGRSALVFALPTLFQLVCNFGSIALWTLAGRIFNVRQGKRLFGLVGAGQWLAIVITGLLIPVLAGALGTPNLLALAFLAVCAELGVLLYVTRVMAPVFAGQTSAPPNRREGQAARASAPGAGPRSQESGPFKSAYALLIFAMTLAWWMAFFFLDNIFYDRAGARYPDAGQLAGFLGFFLAGLGVVTLLCNTFIAGRLIGRLGVRHSIVVLPAVLLGATGLMAVTGSLGAPVTLVFWLAVATKVTDLSLGFSVDRSALTLLYQPLPERQRVQVQATAEGIFQPLAAGLAGLGLLAMAAFPVAAAAARNYGAFLIVAAWLIVVILLGRRYPAVLLAALRRRRLVEIPSAGHFLDPRSPQQPGVIPFSYGFDAAGAANALRLGISSPHPGVAIYALNALQALGMPPEPAMLAGLLVHPVPEVRQEALHYIERRVDEPAVSALLPSVTRMAAEDGVPAVRGAAVRALAASHVEAVSEQASAYLADPEPLVRAAALVGALQSGPAERLQAARQALQQMLASSSPAERARAAQVLGQLGADRTGERPLSSLLQDGDVTVVTAALAAAGQARLPGLWPMVIEALEQPAARGAAAAALAAGGESAIPALATAFARPDLSPAARTEMLRAAGRAGGPAAVEWLTTFLDNPDHALRSHALAGLSRACYQALGSDRTRVEAQLRTEAELAADLATAQADLGADPATSLLRSALAAAEESTRERVFWLLSFIHDPQAVLRARDSLALASPDQRAYALEVLDGLLSQGQKRLLFPLLSREKLPDPGDLTALGGRHRGEPRLAEIAAGEPAWVTGWMKACALYALGRIASGDAARLAGLAGLAEPALRSDSPVVRESALWALRCAGIQVDRRLLAELCADADPAVSRVAQQFGATSLPGRPALATVERVAALKRAGIFAETPDEVLVEVAGALSEVELPADMLVFRKGDPGDAMYLVVEGEVHAHDGEQLLNSLRPGDGFGEMAVLDGQPRSADVTASAPARLLRLSAQDIDRLIDQRPEVARGIIRVLSRHLRSRLQDLASF